MTQTVKGSWTEAAANVAVGFWVNFTANLIILPLFGFSTLSLSKNLAIGTLYTVISLARSYILRRFFNGLRWGNIERTAL